MFLNLAVNFEKIVVNFSPYHKYTLGTEMRNAIRQKCQVFCQLVSVMYQTPM